MSKNKIKIIIGLFFLIIASLAALKYFPLLKYYADHNNAYVIFCYNFKMHLFLVATLLTISLIYIRIDKKLIKNPPSISIILGALIILALILIWVFPIGSSDIFLYLTKARTFAIHGLSPYVTAYSQLTGDAFYPFLKDNHWASYTSSYGPLFTLVAGSLSLVFKTNLLASILLFKGFFATLHIANTWLVDKTLGRRFAWLYALNPLILFEFLINGHNEVLMIFFCLLAFYFLWKKTPSLKNSLLSIFFLTLGILIKFIPLIILPVWGLALLWRLKDKTEKRLFIGLSIPLFLSVVFLTYLPFWQNFSIILNPIVSQMHFTNYLLSSPVITFIYSFLTTMGMSHSWTTAILTSQILFLGFLLFMTIKIIREWREKNVKKLLNYGTLIILAFYASFFSWLMPWYFTFLLLLLLISYSLSNRKGYLITFYAITILELIYYLILR